MREQTLPKMDRLQSTDEPQPRPREAGPVMTRKELLLAVALVAEVVLVVAWLVWLRLN